MRIDKNGNIVKHLKNYVDKGVDKRNQIENEDDFLNEEKLNVTWKKNKDEIDFLLQKYGREINPPNFLNEQKQKDKTQLIATSSNSHASTKLRRRS